MTDGGDGRVDGGVVSETTSQPAPYYSHSREATNWWLEHGNLDQGIVEVGEYGWIGTDPEGFNQALQKARRRRGFDPVVVTLSEEQLAALNENGCVNVESTIGEFRFTLRVEPDGKGGAS